jgi:hypothetical protein
MRGVASLIKASLRAAPRNKIKPLILHMNESGGFYFSLRA